MKAGWRRNWDRRERVRFGSPAVLVTLTRSIVWQKNRKFDENISVMNAAAIRDRLYDYIRVADDKKIRAIYTMLEDSITEEAG
jgi:hypothetical protein